MMHCSPSIPRFLLLLVGLLASAGLRAASPRALVGGSYLGPMAEGSVVFSPASLSTDAIGGAGGLGGVYECVSARNFLLRVGLSLRYDDVSRCLPSGSVKARDVVDSFGDTASVMDYRFSAISARSRSIEPRLSLHMGGAWERFYFLLGGHVGASCPVGATAWSGSYSVTATYPFFNTVFEDMPQHMLYRDLPFSGSVMPRTALTGGVGIELGSSFPLVSRSAYRVGVRNRTPLLRLGFFAEMDLTHLQFEDSELFAYPSDPVGGQVPAVSDVLLRSIDASASDALRRPLPARMHLGLRVAVLFPVSVSRREPCRCLAM